MMLVGGTAGGTLWAKAYDTDRLLVAEKSTRLISLRGMRGILLRVAPINVGSGRNEITPYIVELLIPNGLAGPLRNTAACDGTFCPRHRVAGERDL
jgi:hypothetical protein